MRFQKLFAALIAVALMAVFGGAAMADGFTLPANTASIEAAAFQGCVKLTGIPVIPEGVKEIGDYAFAGCTGFRGVPTIPSTVERIGAHAFDGCTGLGGTLILPEAMDVDATAFDHCPNLKVVRGKTALHVAVIADMGGFEPGTFNAQAYSAAKDWCEQNSGTFKSYPSEGGQEAKALDKAVKDGADVVILTGFEFQSAMDAGQTKYPQIRLVGLDMTEDYLASGVGANVYLASYQEDLPGFMAGYAAVKLGYTHLGFLGGPPIPAIIRYGEGFVHGANQAAKELKNTGKVTVEYFYSGSFDRNDEITARMERWYKELGVQVIFACGGGVFASAGEAAQAAISAGIDAKIIGVDTDQQPYIDEAYGKGVTLTSAMKGIDATTYYVLDRIRDGQWSTLGGRAEVLGMHSVVPEDNFAKLAPTTQFGNGFKYADYKTLVSKLFKKTYTTEGPVDISVNYY